MCRKTATEESVIVMLFGTDLGFHQVLDLSAATANKQFEVLSRLGELLGAVQHKRARDTPAISWGAATSNPTIATQLPTGRAAEGNESSFVLDEFGKQYNNVGHIKTYLAYYPTVNIILN